MRATLVPRAHLWSALLVGMVLVAPAVAGGDLDVTLTNLAPTLTSVTLSSTSVTPTAGSTTAVTVTVVASDSNGYNDIASVMVTVLKPDGSTAHIAEAAASLSSGSGASGTWTYAFNMQFHDAPALLLDSYKVRVVVTDLASASVNNLLLLNTFNYAKLAAVGGTSSAVALGSLSPGTTGATVTQTLQNHGNVRMDVQLTGTDLTHATEAATLGVGNVYYDQTSLMTSKVALSGSAASVANFDLATGASSTKALYWHIAVPAAGSQFLPAGVYQGTLTVTAVEG